MDFPQNSLRLSHKIISENVPEGGFCIDCTAGKGRDTAFLCSLVGDGGKVIAFDIQPSAVEAAKKLILDSGYENICDIYCDGHENILNYAEKNSADGIMFNLGWLPGGDHNIFSKPDTTIKAISDGLEVLKPGGIMSVCIYYGKQCGYEERDRLLEFFPTLDTHKYTVLICSYANRRGDVPIPVFITKNF